MSNEVITKFENICKTLENAFKGVFSWKWDDRFAAVLTEFSAELQENVEKVLNPLLMFKWDSNSIATAPETVQLVKNHLGGLMSSQLLYTSDPKQEEILFGAWWPWGDGSTISLRVSLILKPESNNDQTEALQQLKTWFEI